MGVDVGNRNPLSVGTKDASGNDAVQMRIPSQVVGEGLDGGDHAEANVVIIDSRGHELVDGFVAGAGELGEKLAVEEAPAEEVSLRQSGEIVILGTRIVFE